MTTCLHCTLLCAYPNGAGKTTGHCFTTPYILTTYDFCFFPHMKEKVHGRQFQAAEEFVAATRETILDLPADLSAVISTLAQLHNDEW
jgi:hypothetical protein